MPHCDLQMVGFALYINCVEKLGVKYKNRALMRGMYFPLVNAYYLYLQVM